MRTLACALTLSVGLGAHGALSQTLVDLELVLAADASDSMGADTGLAQRAAFAEAFRSPDFRDAVAYGAHASIALTYVEWGDEGGTAVVLPWMLIDSPASAEQAARRLETAPITRFRRTSISHALAVSVAMFEGNGFHGNRQVVDLSANGPNNHGPSVGPARDAAVAQGVTVNGLAILTDLAGGPGPSATRGPTYLERYFKECVIGGPGAFVLAVRGPEDLRESVLRKLVMEVASPLWPEPQPSAPLRRAVLC